MTEETKYKPKRSDLVNTPVCRGVYVHHLFEPRTKRWNGKPLKSPRRDMNLAIPKTHSDPAQCSNYMFLWGLLYQAASREPLWGGKWPDGGFCPIKDGDAPPKPRTPTPGQPVLTPEQIAAKNAWKRGHWIIEVTNYIKEPGPVVAVLRNNLPEPVLAQTVNGIETFKSGDYCVAKIQAVTFWNDQVGCNFSFDGVCWVKPGERVGGEAREPQSADRMFGGLSVDGGGMSAQPFAPTMPAVPSQPQYAPPAAPQTAPQPPQPAYAAPPVAYAAPAAPVGPPAAVMPGQMPLPPLPGQR